MVKPTSKNIDINSALIGMLSGKSEMSRTEYNHGYKNDDYHFIISGEKTFVDEKAKYLRNFLKPTLSYFIDNSKEHYYKNYKRFKYLYKRFYIKDKKRFTATIFHRFTDISLAFMYMDLGIDYNIDVSQYTLHEQTMINHMIKNKFLIDNDLINSSIIIKEREKFLTLINPICSMFTKEKVG